MILTLSKVAREKAGEMHDPVTLIKGYVETLLESARDNPEVLERFLKIIDRNAQRLDLLIQDLLSISALESGRGVLDVYNEFGVI